MTLIECFDRSVAENLVSCLHLRPEKIIFLGENKKMQPQLQRYRQFFAGRGWDVEIQTCHVRMDSMEDIIQKLNGLVRAEPASIIDITGGDERLLMAVGAVMHTLEEPVRSRVSVQHFDLADGTAQDCDGDGDVIEGHPAQMTVEEMVALHGGAVLPVTPQPSLMDTPKDLQPLWELASDEPRIWNRWLAILEEFESRADSRNQVFLPLQAIKGGISNFDDKIPLLRSLLARFREKGIVTDCSTRNYLEYTYTTKLNRRCTLRAGNILEVKTLLEARAAQLHGEDFFTDCQMGVYIDWDGVIYDSLDRVPETRNEIDLILMRGMTPLFVSCKNGDIDEVELYKLHTVATRFGGPDAKKMLIATHFEKKNPGSALAFVQRAADMGIYLVPNAASLSGAQWLEVFQNALK